MKVSEQVIRLAQKHDPMVNKAGKERKQYKGCDVYSPYCEENGKPVERYIGRPYYILHDKAANKLRYVDGDEAMEIMRQR